MELSRDTSEDSVSKVEKRWKRIWTIFESEEWKSGKNKEFEWLLYAFHKLVCPGDSLEELRKEVEVEVESIKEEKSAKEKLRRKEAWNYHLMTCLLDEDKDKINLEIEKKQQEKELKELRKEMEVLKKERQREEDLQKQKEQMETLRREKREREEQELK